MAQSISLWGATYQNVPAVDLPKSPSGTARFTDVTDTTAAAADVASGKYFYTAAGVRTQGTASGGGGAGLTIATATATLSSASASISFSVSGDPTSFAVVSASDLATGASPYKAAAVVYDGASLHGAEITNTSNAQVTATTDFSKSYSGGTLTITSTGPYFQANEYVLVYTYGGGAIDTQDVQVGSGATSITFTDLEDEPEYFSCIFKSNFSTSSGYQRVIVVVYDGTDIYGMEMDSSAKYSDVHWSFSYSNGSLTISSQGTNAGGYFHQPGSYQLTYAYDDGSGGNYQSKTVTPTEQTQVVTADSQYDALKKVTVNPIPSEYIVPTGNYAITSNGNNINIAQYATVSVNVSGGGGSVQFDTKTATGGSDYPTSLSFSSMKGEPKMFAVRLNAQVSSSGNTTYYYIVDMVYTGSTIHGNCFRIGGTRRVDNITSGYSWSYSGTTLTVTSSAASRSASPGAFYSGSYELVYVY